MKTTDLFKPENAQSEFKRELNGGVYRFNEQGVLYRDFHGKRVTNVSIGINDKWTLIPKEIPWQEALDKWLKGIAVICEIDGNKYTFTEYDYHTVSRNELIRGKWFLV